jgi:hypothetical protein
VCVYVNACAFACVWAGKAPLTMPSPTAALGSIATADVLPLLRQYRQDGEPVVRESCEVALDMYAWETSNTFQYADGLAQIAATGAAPAPASATTS